MGEFAARRSELTPLALPRRGLDQLLRGWTSDGQVFDALSAVGSFDTDWSARDIERRASRVLLDKIESDIRALPSSVAGWLENLPITTTSIREVSSRPLRPTDWAASARRHGWPPRAFIGKPRSRVRDEITLQVLAWTARRLEAIVREVNPLAPLLVGRVEPQVTAMAKAVDQELADVEIARPDRLDIRSLASAGTPWSALAAVADVLQRAETDLKFLAFEVIEPMPELEWRLFHLSVLGECLATLRDLGGRVRWAAPLNASGSSGPQFQITLDGNTWDLWFEASAAPRRYQVKSPYRTATAGVKVLQKPLGADIMLCLPGERSLMFECKWSADGTYVGRDGYHQATSYLIEAKSGIAVNAWSYVIGPEEVVPALSEAALDWPGGTTVVGAGNIEHVAGLIHSAVAGT